MPTRSHGVFGFCSSSTDKKLPSIQSTTASTDHLPLDDDQSSIPVVNLSFIPSTTFDIRTAFYTLHAMTTCQCSEFKQQHSSSDLCSRTFAYIIMLVVGKRISAPRTALRVEDGSTPYIATYIILIVRHQNVTLTFGATNYVLRKRRAFSEYEPT